MLSPSPHAPALCWAICLAFPYPPSLLWGLLCPPTFRGRTAFLKKVC